MKCFTNILLKNNSVYKKFSKWYITRLISSSNWCVKRRSNKDILLMFCFQRKRFIIPKGKLSSCQDPTFGSISCYTVVYVLMRLWWNNPNTNSFQGLPIAFSTTEFIVSSALWNSCTNENLTQTISISLSRFTKPITHTHTHTKHKNDDKTYNHCN